MSIERVVIGYGGVAICPNCGGAMRLQHPLLYRCIDCKSGYRISGEGIADKEVLVQRKEKIAV